VKQRESWEGAKGNLDESTALYELDDRDWIGNWIGKLDNVDESTPLSEGRLG